MARIHTQSALGMNCLHPGTSEHMFVCSGPHGLCHLAWESPHLDVDSLSCRSPVGHGEMWALPRGDSSPLSPEVCGIAVKTCVSNVFYEGCNVAHSEGYSAKSQERCLIYYSTT